MKLSLGDLLVPAILLGAAGWWGYSTWSDHVAKNRTEQTQQAASAEHQHAIEAMAARHNATPGLTGKLAQGAHLYTFNVQNALLASTGRAVVFAARVTDLEKRGSGCALHLDDASTSSPTIRYVLEGDAALAAKIVEMPASAPEVMVVAVIDSVEKAEFAPAEPARFIAKGRCLDLVTQ